MIRRKNFAIRGGQHIVGIYQRVALNSAPLKQLLRRTKLSAFPVRTLW